MNSFYYGLKYLFIKNINSSHMSNSLILDSKLDLINYKY